MSHSPTAQLGHGTGSGCRTMPATCCPGVSPLPGGASTTSPSDSWPRIRRSAPGGAVPYSPRTISMSVPHTPMASVRTSTDPAETGGSGTSSSRAERAMRGCTGDRCSRRVPPGYGAVELTLPAMLGRSGLTLE